MHLEFHGAAGQVTGACFLLRTQNLRILIDCGLIQGTRREEARNRAPFPFKADQLDAVILSHAHLDHSGRLPLLIKAGFKGHIYAQRATRDLCRIMLRDAAYINEKEADWNNTKRRRKGLAPIEPLYNTDDATATLRRFRVIDYENKQDILPGLRVRLKDAGHILGSAIVEVWVNDQGVQRKIVYSGDLGHHGAPILNDPAIVERADLLLLESTYGDRAHRGWDETWRELGAVFAHAAKARGNILIPAFAVGRTQELLYAFAKHYREWKLDNWTFFLDSPLAIEATKLYSHHRDLYDLESRAAGENGREAGGMLSPPRLHISRTTLQSMGINRIRSGAAVIAGSGMCTGGRIKHHLKHNVWRENCHLIIVGFQAPGTLGRALVDGARHIRLWGETVRVAARVHTIGGLSAHADQQGLIDWYKNFRKPPKVALVHGEPEALSTLAERLRTELRADVRIPEFGTTIDLAKL